MCILTFIPAGIQPNTKALANGAEINNDGHGYAIVTGSRIIVGHGMDSAKVIAEFAARRAKHPDGPALFHSRWSTHGSITKANCHPFRVGGDKRTVLAHNGVLPSLVQPGKGDRRSDTRIAAEDYLPVGMFGPLTSEAGRQGVEKWMGSGNKIVILTVDPAYGGQAFILNERAGIWDDDDGIWYSNNGYQDYQAPSRAFSSRAWWDDEAADVAGYEMQCGVCETGEIHPVTGYCQLCGACMDCESEEGVCDCYYPAAVKPRKDDGGRPCAACETGETYSGFCIDCGACVTCLAKQCDCGAAPTAGKPRKDYEGRGYDDEVPMMVLGRLGLLDESGRPTPEWLSPAASRD